MEGQSVDTSQCLSLNSVTIGCDIAPKALRCLLNPSSLTLLAVTTKSYSSVARSLKLRDVDLDWYLDG